jgi:hypothetical protein
MLMPFGNTKEMLMPTETQEHILQDGTIEISRNGNHQYWISDGEKMSSVTTMLGHLDSGAFGAGLGWGLKMARENDGDLDAPRRLSKEAQDEGNRLHDAIHQFIENGIVDETNDLFVTWLNQIGNHYEWSASERFLYHPVLMFGGTVDSFSKMPGADGTIIWDWKTKSKEQIESIRKNGPLNKDVAQVSAYTHALHQMKSQLSPTEAKIAYIARDASDVVVVDVDLEYGWELFKASHHIYTLLKGASQ